MAKKKRGKSKSKTRKHGTRKTGKKRAGKKAGRRPAAKAKAHHKVHALTAPADQVWGIQNALRKKKYFARVVGPGKIATTAPSLRG